MKPAFRFDSQSCSGCKACQAACKDKNQLPTGILWRRVYEVVGGSWNKKGNAWESNVFAYNISMSCNHCEHPICAGVCPTNAYITNPDGIIQLDQTRCTGCGYCAWACPYGAPQLDLVNGTMTKCNFCIDELEKGQKPACVNACPMRCLEVIDLEEGFESDLKQSIPPMPEPNERNPKLFIHPHPAVERALLGDVIIANQEEVHTRWVGRFEELPLVAFTLLAQMSIGLSWSTIGLMEMMIKGTIPQNQLMLQVLLGLCIVFIGAAFLTSIGHLRNPRNAWRVLSNLRKSRLSREILFSGIFAMLCIFSFLSINLDTKNIHSYILNILNIFTGLSGAAAIWSMAGVYRLKTNPKWNTLSTHFEFFTSSILMGLATSITIYAIWTQTKAQIINLSILLISTLLILALIITGNSLNTQGQKKGKLRFILIMSGLIILTVNHYYPIPNYWLFFPILILVFIEEIIGRSLFYEKRELKF